MLSKLKFDPDPLIFHFRKLLNFQIVHDIGSISEKSWKIANGGFSVYPKAIYLKKHLDFDLKTVDGETVQGEIRRISGRKVLHRPTIMYRINEAKVLSGLLYKSGFRLRLNDRKELLSNIFGQRSLENEGLLVSSWSSNKYFGHWLHDECPRVLAGADLGIPVYRTGREKYVHQEGYEKILGLESRDVDRAFFKKLYVLSDSTLNDHRQKRFRRLRDLASKESRDRNKYIFIKRGILGAKGRSLVNEESLIQMLRKLGFCIIEPEKMSPLEIVQVSNNAIIIMGVEGSSLAHAFLNISQTGTIVSLVPESRFTNPFMDICSSIGIKYAFLVGRKSGNGFVIEERDVEKLLKQLDEPFVFNSR